MTNKIYRQILAEVILDKLAFECDSDKLVEKAISNEIDRADVLMYDLYKKYPNVEGVVDLVELFNFHTDVIYELSDCDAETLDEICYISARTINDYLFFLNDSLEKEQEEEEEDYDSDWY